MIILRASDWFFGTSGLEQKTAAVAKRGVVEFPFARSTVSRTMSAADFDSLDFITFKSDASRGKVRDFSPCRILCNEYECSQAQSLDALTINLQIRFTHKLVSDSRVRFLYALQRCIELLLCFFVIAGQRSKLNPCD